MYPLTRGGDDDYGDREGSVSVETRDFGSNTVSVYPGGGRWTDVPDCIVNSLNRKPKRVS